MCGRVVLTGLVTWVGGRVWGVAMCIYLRYRCEFSARGKSTSCGVPTKGAPTSVPSS